MIAAVGVKLIDAEPVSAPSPTSAAVGVSVTDAEPVSAPSPVSAAVAANVIAAEPAMSPLESLGPQYLSPKNFAPKYDLPNKTTPSVSYTSAMNTLPIVVTSDGEVLFEGKKCTTQRDSRGYNTVRIALHRLVAHAYHGPPPTPEHVVHHIDNNPRNNAASNLEWLTQAENTRRYFKGRLRKLTPSKVNAILAQKPLPHVTLKQLADSFGVGISAARAIRSGHNHKGEWKKTSRGILTAAQVEIIRAWQKPVLTAATLARKYHVSDATILNIWHGRY